MPQNTPFTTEEDKIIRYLYDDLKIKKWALVAKKMSEDYKIERNAKQCRDRYRQFLNPTCCSEWTPQQQKQLYHLHNTVGNKWALIASHFPGKTDNYVKNHFYSKLRKALRHLNRIIKQNFRRDFKEIKIATIYKIIEGFQEQFKQKPIVSQEVSSQCCILKDALISFADESDEVQERLDCSTFWKERVLIERIMQFNRSYKKKSKKEKRQSLQLDQLFKPAKRIQLIMEVRKEEEENSQFEKVSSIDSSDEEDNDQKEQKSYRDQSMKQEREDIRKSPPIYVIFKEDENLRESPNSVRSGIDIRLSDVVSSNKMEEEDNKMGEGGQNVESHSNQKESFGFLRGESSFRSYRSQSVKSQYSKTDMFGDIRFSAGLKEVADNEMENERDQSLFRSHK